MLRKYLYIYGGFSFDCTTACFDLWRYEISYGPYNFYPRKDFSEWHNFGNHWVLLNEGDSYGPGPRWRHSMLAHQSYPEGNSTRNEHFLYIFGGIKVQSEAEVRAKRSENPDYDSSYEYMGDLWRYDLVSNQWEEVEVYGIATVKR